jgi:hypothetical protein
MTRNPSKYSVWPRSAPGATLRRQRGAAALLMIITLIVILTIVLAPRLTLWQVRNAASDRGYQTLMAAKAAILAHAANPGADAPPVVRRLGQISLTPDLPITAGTTFTGLAGLTPGGQPGCATRIWVPGQALSDPNAANTAAKALDVRCFGRFPWLSYGLEGPSTADDEGGAVPWMFISANLVVGAPCLLNLNPLMLSSGYTGGCTTAVPFPWLNVVDDRGNLLSSEVAIVLILPGPPVNAAQQRTTPNDRSPAAYLEGLTVAAGCTAPCVAGTYNNAAYTVANGLAWTFVDAPPSTALSPQPSYYQQPFAFNDRLIYVTASEYFEAMETRARLAALGTLNAFKASYGFLPYSGDNASPATPLTASCTLNSRFGLLPAGTACSGPGPAPPAVNYPSWYTLAGWGSYFIYAVDVGCVAGAAAPRCLAPTMKLGGAGTPSYNAVLFSPGRAIQKAPFAVSKGAAQAPMVGGVSGRLADFLDSTKNVTGPPFDATGTAPTANYDDRMYGIP